MRVFISYRREDLHGLAEGLVGRIYDRLADKFGHDNVFMDVDSIPPGADFGEHLENSVARADVLLAVMGPEWARIIRERRNDAEDFVRIEIESALARGLPVIPLLVAGTEFPAETDLPESILALSHRNAFPVSSGRDFHPHMDRLISELEEFYGGVRIVSEPAAPGAPSDENEARVKPAEATTATEPKPVARPGARTARIFGRSPKDVLRRSLIGVGILIGTYGAVLLAAFSKPFFFSYTQAPPAPIVNRDPAPGENFTNDAGMGMVWCPAGRFEETGYNREVIVEEGFWIARFEVTQEQWETLLGDNPSRFVNSGPQAPVERVSWGDAMAFCGELTEKERAAGTLPEGWEYVLPTEMQWKWACGAGVYLINREMDRIAWYGRDSYFEFWPLLDPTWWSDCNSYGRTHSVGRKMPNNWGIHDMRGNVSEWCSDSFEEPEERRVHRGGSWNDHREQGIRAFPSQNYDFVGFRPVLSTAPSRK